MSVFKSGYPKIIGFTHVSLDNFEHFREIYGFIASDDLLRASAIMLHDANARSWRPE